MGNSANDLIRRTGSGSSSGGVSVDLTQVTWDDGDWPFAAYFALNYPNPDDDLPLDDMREALMALAGTGGSEAEPEAK